jgi:hypothetical protein
VTGGIAILDEEDVHASTRAALAERAPYVMACLVGQRQPDEPVEVLRVYLHPLHVADLAVAVGQQLRTADGAPAVVGPAVGPLSGRARR